MQNFYVINAIRIATYSNAILEQDQFDDESDYMPSDYYGNIGDPE